MGAAARARLCIQTGNFPQQRIRSGSSPHSAPAPRWDSRAKAQPKGAWELHLRDWAWNCRPEMLPVAPQTDWPLPVSVSIDWSGKPVSIQRRPFGRGAGATFLGPRRAGSKPQVYGLSRTTLQSRGVLQSSVSGHRLPQTVHFHCSSGARSGSLRCGAAISGSSRSRAPGRAPQAAARPLYRRRRWQPGAGRAC